MSELTTALYRTLNLEYPIVQAPIGSDPELAAAVSGAGGLGMQSITWTDPEKSRDSFEKPGQ